MNVKISSKKINLKKVFYAIIGSFSTWLTEFIITIVLTEIMGIPHRISYATALIIGLIFIFHFHKQITFKSKKIIPKSGVKFTVLYLMAYLINWILVSILSYFINYILAIIIVNTLLWPILFVGNDKWVFKKISEKRKARRKKRLEKKINKMIPKIKP